jgi:hypothetical protein
MTFANVNFPLIFFIESSWDIVDKPDGSLPANDPRGKPHAG